MLYAKAIRITRRRKPLLAGADLQVTPGELVALIGPNGAGKSTLLHTLSGATRADSGVVCINGRAIQHWSQGALARCRAVLPQMPELGFALRVREVVALGRSAYAGLARRADNERVVATAMAETGVAHLSERSYPTLSGGERQRVQLARVLAQVWPEGPTDAAGRYLLLDEPTNNLDIAHQRNLIETAWRFSRRGNGVLTVLHDPNLAAGHADRLVVLVDGTIAAAGTPEQVLTAELLKRAFGMKARVLSHPDTGRPYLLPT